MENWPKDPYIKEIDCSDYFDIDKYRFDSTVTENTRFVSMKVIYKKDNLINDSEYEKFLLKIKEIINSEHFVSVLCKPIEFQLLPLDKKINRICNHDGSQINPNDKNIALLEDIELRSLFLFYFESNTSKDILENIFGKIFSVEGEMGNEWN